MVKNDVTVVARSRKIAIVENRVSKRTGPSLGSLGGSRRRQDDILPPPRVFASHSEIRLCSARRRRTHVGRGLEYDVMKPESGMAVSRGYHFFINPGPTNIPDRVLRAMDRGAIDFNGAQFRAITEECFAAREGGGATLNGHPIHVSDRGQIEGARMLGPKNTFAE